MGVCVVYKKSVPGIETSAKLGSLLMPCPRHTCCCACRHEGGGNREATASNLQAAGYGTPCKDQLGTDQKPCYLQLDMRAIDDTRLASVYKPDKRAQLEGQGYSMAGSIGDQWSDLAGTSPATASFKLPNPMYYIL